MPAGDSEDCTPLVQILDAPVLQTMEEVFDVGDRILLRTFEPQGELFPQERVLSHSVQQRIVLSAVDLPEIDPVLQVFVAARAGLGAPACWGDRDVSEDYNLLAPWVLTHGEAEDCDCLLVSSLGWVFFDVEGAREVP